MHNEDLRRALDRLNERTNQQWMAILADRKLRELEFHNQNRDYSKAKDLAKDTYEKLYGNKKYYSTVAMSTNYVEDWIARMSPGKVFLDYACGDGFNAIKAAKAGASLSIGIDISDVSVQNASGNALAATVGDRAVFVQADCENTGLPDSCIDVAICSGMLHHIDLSYAFPEIRRILKPGGVILGVEALDYNPIIKLYRNLTPDMRTEWEKNHILSYRDLDFAARFFDVKNVRHWHLFSIAGAFAPKALPLLNALDSIAMTVPGVRLMSWMFTFELWKRAKE